MSRISIAVAALALIVSAAGIVLNFVRDPFDPNRAELEERLKEIPSASAAPESAFKADYDTWKKNVDGRKNLWDALVARPVAKAAPPDPSKEMEGITVLPGSSGSGANARVRLASPANPRGRMYKVGESVTPNVTVKGVEPKSIAFDVKVGGQVVPFSMPR
jgi:hypothetical protein